MPEVKGTWKEGETYAHLNIVALNGSSFIARHDDPGQCPGDGWQLIASAGKPGKPGPKGDRGDAGPTGVTKVIMVDYKDWEVDRAKYTLTPILPDGSRGKPVPLRGLFEQYDGERNG
jgi:hypothetical protein